MSTYKLIANLGDTCHLEYGGWLLVERTRECDEWEPSNVEGGPHVLLPAGSGTGEYQCWIYHGLDVEDPSFEGDAEDFMGFVVYRFDLPKTDPRTDSDTDWIDWPGALECNGWIACNSKGDTSYTFEGGQRGYSLVDCRYIKQEGGEPIELDTSNPMVRASLLRDVTPHCMSAIELDPYPEVMSGRAILDAIDGLD